MVIDPYSKAQMGLLQKLDSSYTSISSDVYKGSDVAIIANPCMYHNSIDQSHRISKFFRTRMSIIDLIPCDYRFDFTAADEKDSHATGLKPKISYGAVDNFVEITKSYGLTPAKCVRIYSTDDTQASDQINNQLKDNYFQSGINKVSEYASPLRDMMNSLDSKSVDSLISSMPNIVKGEKPVTEMPPTAKKLASIAADITLKGHRVSLPSIWSNTTYTPNLSVNLRLVSPYGHPAAIKEFIIKPLMYLLILSSPKTAEGVSYGRPYFLTIKGYGLNYSPIGIISNITLRRAGSDTAYNINRQPLSINISLDFEYAVKGFAHYDTAANNESVGDGAVFGSADQPEYLMNENDGALTTIKHIVKSLRPRPTEESTESYSAISIARNTKPDDSPLPPLPHSPPASPASPSITSPASSNQATMQTANETATGISNSSPQTTGVYHR